MSKLADRLPAVVTKAQKLEIANNALALATQEDGRVNLDDLVDQIEQAIVELPVNEDLIIKEGRRSAAQQIASAWTNARTIKLDREQRIPVYQSQFAFADHYFKVGSQFVPAASMTAADFEVLIERHEHRIENAQIDLSIWRDLYERARPGLEAGQNLVDQFETGVLQLVAVSGREIEAGDETEES
jgi:hypothetical protein